MKKVLLFCSDQISRKSKYLTGGGLRSEQLFQNLSKVFDVTVLEPKNNIDDLNCINGTYENNFQNQNNLIEEYKPNFSYFVNPNSCCIEQLAKTPYAVDVHGPIFIESALLARDDISSHRNKFFSVLQNSLSITSVSTTQIDALNFFGAGYKLKNFFHKKNFCIPLNFTPQQKIILQENSQKIIGYCGSLYPWTSPFTTLSKISKYLRSNLKLVIYSYPHQGTINFNQDLRNLMNLGVSKNTIIYGLVPREELNNFLSKVFVMLDLSDFSPERSVCVSTRSAEYIGLGIPVIVNDFSFFGRLFSSFNFNELVVSKSNSISKILEFISNSNVSTRNTWADRQSMAYSTYIKSNNEIDEFIDYIEDCL